MWEKVDDVQCMISWYPNDGIILIEGLFLPMSKFLSGRGDSCTTIIGILDCACRGIVYAMHAHPLYLHSPIITYLIFLVFILSIYIYICMFEY